MVAETKGDSGLKTGLFISLLNPAIALVIACAFLVLWLYQRQRRHLAVLALGYAASAVGFLLQYFTLPVGLPVSRLFSVTCFTSAVFCVAGAAVASCGKKAPYAAMGVLGAAGLAALLLVHVRRARPDRAASMR